MNILHLYSKELNKKGIEFKLIDFILEKNEWRYQLLCTKPVNDAEKLDKLFKELNHFVGDLILDGYDVEVVDNFNFLIKKNPDLNNKLFR